MATDVSTDRPAGHPALKALGSRLQYGIFALLVRCRLLFLAKLLLFVVVAWYCCVPSVRRRAYPYLAHRYPGCKGVRRFVRVYALYLRLAQTILARMVAGITGNFPFNLVAPQLVRIVKENTDRGLIVLSAHFGGWQLGMAGLERFGRAVQVVQWASPGETDRHYFERGKGRAFGIIDAANPAGAMVAAAAALRRGEIVCLMGDRLAGDSAREKSVSVPFLGGTIRLPVTAYALASMTGANLAVVFTVWQGGRLCLHEARVLDIPQGLSHKNAANFLPYATAFAASLERAVQCHPDQFYNFYDMWAQSPKSG